MLDTQVLSELQRVTVEATIDGGLTWSSGLWTPAEVIGYANQRQRRFIQETGIIVSRTTLPIVPQIHNHALPQTWLGTHRVAWKEPDPLAVGLVSFWPLNELSGTRFDVIGSNHLTEFNGPVPSMVGLPGLGGRAALLDKASSQALFILNANQNGLVPHKGDMSICIWVYPTDLGLVNAIHAPILINKGATFNDPYNSGYSLGIRPTDFGAESFWRTPSVIFGAPPAFIRGGQENIKYYFQEARWTFCVVTYKRNGDMRFFADGVQRAKFEGLAGGFESISGFGDTTDDVNMVNNTAAFTIGAFCQNTGGVENGFFTGGLQGAGYWARVLQLEDVQRLFNNGLGYIPQKYSYTEIPRTDGFEHDHLNSSWARDAARPTGYGDGDTPTLILRLLPAPLASGNLDFSYFEQPATLSNTGIPYALPDEFAQGVKWGVLADMLSKVGRGQDLIRAQAAEQLYEQAVTGTKLMLLGLV